MWKELSQQSHIDELMLAFGSFHDSCIKEIAVRNREYVTQKLAMSFDNLPVVRFLFQRQFNGPTAIEIQFEDVQAFHWLHDNLFDDTSKSLIYQAICFYQEGIIYWAEDIDWQLTSSDRDDFRWIAAKSAKWRVVDDGKGADDKLLSFS